VFAGYAADVSLLKVLKMSKVMEKWYRYIF
jgi:hypothetical protein